jgi:hypothetical protein
MSNCSEYDRQLPRYYLYYLCKSGGGKDNDKDRPTMLYVAVWNVGRRRKKENRNWFVGCSTTTAAADAMM